MTTINPPADRLATPFVSGAAKTPPSADADKNRKSAIADDKAMLRAASELTRDLLNPSARIYWTDMLASTFVGYAGIAGAILAPSTAWMLCCARNYSAAGRSAEMEIRFNSDNSVDGHADLAKQVEDRVAERLDTRFGDRLTTVEVHVRDVDGLNNRPDGIEATIEARPAGSAPIAVTGRAGEPKDAVNDALGTLVSRLDSMFGKADRHRQ